MQQPNFDHIARKNVSRALRMYSSLPTERRAELAIFEDWMAERQHALAVVKNCSCGEEYSRQRWLSLTERGVQEDPTDPAENLDLRNCLKCGSTMALPVLEVQL